MRVMRKERKKHKSSLVTQRIQYIDAAEEQIKLETDTAVNFSHVVVNTLTLRERLETDPACVRATTCARDVVAPCTVLDGCMAAWTFLDVVNPQPLLKQPVPSIFAVRARDALMVLHVA